ncbi:MAG TPA: hypothetical protein ENI87_02745 [bacterium]|nr:hypothetical protein [bacterium]
MPQLQVKKAVAVCFLEAARLTLEHVGQRHMERTREGIESSELLQHYSHLRRLRDHLQRSIGSYPDVVPLSLSAEDASILVACCRRAVEAIEQRLESCTCSPDEIGWLERKRQVLSDWAVEIAGPPLLDLMLGYLVKSPTPAMRALESRLQTKVYGDVCQRPKITGVHRVGERRAGPPAKSQGVSPFDGELGPMESTATLGEEPSAAAPAPARSPDRLLDPSRLKDPRLRSLAELNLTALSRATVARDYRIAAVMLAAVMECVVLDAAMPVRADLGLSTAVDTWKLQDVLVSLLAEEAQPKDRAVAFHLFSIRNVLRPALQIVTPLVVTEASFARLRTFVERCLHTLGYGATTIDPLLG